MKRRCEACAGMARSRLEGRGPARGEVEGRRREGQWQIWERAGNGRCVGGGGCSTGPGTSLAARASEDGDGGGVRMGRRWESHGVVECAGAGRVWFGRLSAGIGCAGGWGGSSEGSRRGGGCSGTTGWTTAAVVGEEADAAVEWLGAAAAAVGVEYFDLGRFGEMSGRRLKSLLVPNIPVSGALPRE